MKNKDGSFVVIFKNQNKEEVFLVYRSDLLIWNLPGGGIEENETPEEAAIRETFEETGFKIKLLKKVGIYKNIDTKTGGIWNTTFLFVAKIVSGKYLAEFPGCKGQWFKIDNLPNDAKYVTRLRINDVFCYKSAKPFIKEFRPQK